MSGSAGASHSRKVPLPPGDTSEQTVDYVRGAAARRPAVDSLLPPGAEEEPAPPPLLGSAPFVAEFIAPEVGPRDGGLSAPKIEADDGPAVRQISPAEKEQRRFWKNVIVFGVCLVVLMVVCFLLAR